MTKTKIVLVDDDEDIRDVLNVTLTEEGFDCLEATNGEEGLKIVKSNNPELIIVDYNMPKMNGPMMVAAIKKDILLRHLPIIMLTGKSDISDKVSGINAGADDYLIKPFEPQELLARIKMILRRTEQNLDANPLTRLPGNVSILNELQTRIDNKSPMAVAYVDLDKFKAYNDKYGFRHGDDVIRETARILIRVAVVEQNENFVGHIGGDDFVVLTTPDKVDELCKRIIAEFDAVSPSFYSEEDRQAGFIVAKSRKGTKQKFGLLSISIGVVLNEKKELTHPAEIGEIGAELKGLAKQTDHSSYIKDQRSDTRESSCE